MPAPSIRWGGAAVPWVSWAAGACREAKVVPVRTAFIKAALEEMYPPRNKQVMMCEMHALGITSRMIVIWALLLLATVWQPTAGSNTVFVPQRVSRTTDYIDVASPPESSVNMTICRHVSRNFCQNVSICAGCRTAVHINLHGEFQFVSSAHIFLIWEAVYLSTNVFTAGRICVVSAPALDAPKVAAPGSPFLVTIFDTLMDTDPSQLEHVSLAIICGGSQFLLECAEKSSDSCGVFLCRVVTSFCPGQRVLLSYTSSSSAAVDATVRISPSASLSVVPALIPERFNSIFVKLSVSYYGQSCPAEGVNVSITNQESHSTMLLPPSIDSAQTCLDVLQVCYPTHFDKNCHIVIQGLSIVIAFDGLFTRLSSAALFPVHVSPVVVMDSPSAVSFTVKMSVPEFHALSFIGCDLVVAGQPLSSVHLYKSIDQIGVFRGQGSICTNNDCSNANPALSIIRSSKFDIRCFSGLQFPNGSSFVSQSHVSVIRPCFVLLSVNATSPSSARARILVGGSVYVSVVDPLFCVVNSSLNLLLTSNNFGSQVNISLPFVSGNQCGKQVSFGPSSDMHLGSSADVTFLYCSGGSRVCRTASLRLIGPVSFSLSHFVLPSRSAQMVLLSLIDYSSSNNVSISSQIGNSTKEELVLYETSEGSGIFQSLSLMCCDVDGCPGISAAAGFTVAFYYKSQVLRDSLKCLSNSTFVNTSDCLNSLIPSPDFSRFTQSLSVYNFFADAPFSLSLQHQPITQSLRFIGVSILCNNSVAVVPLYRSSAISFDGTFTSISSLCTNVKLGSHVKFTTRVGNDYVTATAVVENAPVASIMVDPSQLVVQGAHVHVTVRRNQVQCKTCNGQLMLNIRSSGSFTVVPFLPLHENRDFFLTFRICGPEETLYKFSECVSAAAGDTITLETPGAEDLRVLVQTTPSLMVSATHLVPEACFFVFISNFSKSMSLRLEASELVPQRNDYGSYFVRGCLSRDRVLYINGQVGINSSLLPSFTFRLLVSGTQVSSAKVRIMTAPLTVEIVDFPLSPFLERDSSLILMVAVRYFYLSHANLSVFASSGQILTIPFLVDSTSAAHIPVVLDSVCHRNTTQICAHNGIVVIASVCFSSCVSSRPIQVYFSPEIHVPTEHPAGTIMQIALLDSSVESSFIFVNISVGASHLTHRLYKNLSSGLFKGSISVMDFDHSRSQSTQQFVVGKAPYVLSIEYSGKSKSVKVIKQSIALLSCFKEPDSFSAFQVFRLVLSHSGSVAPEHIDVKLSSSISVHSQDIRLFRTPNSYIFLGFLNVSSAIVAVFGPRLKVSYFYDFEFQTSVTSCNVSLENSGSLVVSPPAISAIQGFEILAINYSDTNSSSVLIEACLFQSVFPCINLRLELKSPYFFFAVFNSSYIFPFIQYGSMLSPLTVCFTFGPFRSCIVIADRFQLDHPRVIFPQGSVALISKSFVPVSDNMPKYMVCSFFAPSEASHFIFNISLVWNVSLMSFSSIFVVGDECRGACDSIHILNAICRYGSIASTISMSIQAPSFIRIQIPDSFVPKSCVLVTVIDADANQDSSLVEHVVVDINSDDMFVLKMLELVETGPSTGMFRSNISVGLSTRLTVSFLSLNGQSVSASSASSGDFKADLSVMHCNPDVQCSSPKPFQLPLRSQFTVCSLSFFNLALKLSCSSSGQLLIPVPSDYSGHCWSVFVLFLPSYVSELPKSPSSNQFACFAEESSLVVSSVVMRSHPLIPISPVVMYVIPPAPVLFASPIYFSSNVNVSVFLQNVQDSAPQVLKVVSSNGYTSNITMTLSKVGDFAATFNPAAASSSLTNTVLKFIWRDPYRNSDLEYHVAACSPAVLNTPTSIGFQGIANISIFKNQASLQIVLQVTNAATKQIMFLPVYEKFTNASGTMYQATLHISSSRSGFGSNGQPLLYALIGTVLVVSFEDSCPFSVLQAAIHVTPSNVGSIQVPSTVLAGGILHLTIRDSDFLRSNSSMNSFIVSIQASSSIDVKYYEFPAQEQMVDLQILTTIKPSLMLQNSLLVNSDDNITLVYEDAAPYKRTSVVISVTPSCLANFSVGPLPLEINRNISIRVMDCDVSSSAVSVQIRTLKSFCDLNLSVSPSVPGVFTTSIVLKRDGDSFGQCASLFASAGDLITFRYVDYAPYTIIQLDHILKDESVAELLIHKQFVMLNEVAQVSLTVCMNSDIVDPVYLRNTRAPPLPKFSSPVVSDVAEIQLVKVSYCLFIGSIRPVLQPVSRNQFDHKWKEFYSWPCPNCIFANEGDQFTLWWQGSRRLEASFFIIQRAVIVVPLSAAAGSQFEIQVFDRDADFNSTSIDSAVVTVSFLDNEISVALLENATNSGIFHGIIYLSNFLALSSMAIPFLSTSSTHVTLRYSDKNPAAIIETKVSLTSNHIATLEISPKTGHPGSIVSIQVLDSTRNQSPFVRENVTVSVQGSSIAPRTVWLIESSENSGVFIAEFILSNGSAMYNEPNPFGIRSLPGQKYSIMYTNSAPYAVLTKNIVMAGPGRILVSPIDLARVVQVTLIDPDNSDFYVDGSSVRKIQNLVATSATGTFLAFTVQERDPGSGTFYGTFNVSSSTVFVPGVLIGVSLATQVQITYLDALPSILITEFVKVASIGSIIMSSSSSGSAAADSAFVFKVVDFDMNLDPRRRENVTVLISHHNSNSTVVCFEFSVDSSDFVCQVYFDTQMSSTSTLDPSILVLPASRGQVFVMSYLDVIPTPATFRTASITVARAGVLTSNVSAIHVGREFSISLENVHSNTNPIAKDSVFLTVEHWFAGFLQSSIDFALPETLISSAVFMGIVATSPLPSPQSIAFASVVVPSVKPGSVLIVIFRQPAFSLILNVSVIVLSTPVVLVPAILLNTDSSIEVSISNMNLNATNTLTPSLNVTVSQTTVIPHSALTLTLFVSLSNSGLFTGTFRICSVPNCTSDLFAPEGSSVKFSYVNAYTGFEVELYRSVSTRGRIEVPKFVFQNTLFIRVFDIDMDVSFALDTLTVIASVVGYTQTVSITLSETDSKSGIFQGMLLVKDISTPTSANAINVPSNGTIQLMYADTAPSAVVLSSVRVSVPTEITFSSPIVVGDYFTINISDTVAVGPQTVLELSFWGGSTRVILELFAPGVYSGRAIIADKCSNATLFSGCLAIVYGADVQVLYRGSSLLSVTIPKSAMISMVPTIQVCVSGQCTSSWSQNNRLVIKNGGIASVLVVDYDLASMNSLSRFLSVSCGIESDSVYLDVSRGNLSPTQFSASVTVFSHFGDYVASISGTKINCLPASVITFQIRDCDLSKIVSASVRVIDAPQFERIPSFVIGDFVYLELHDFFTSLQQVPVICTSFRDSETVLVRRKLTEGTFEGSVYTTAALTEKNDGRLSVFRTGEHIECKYVSDATSFDAHVTSVAKYCYQSFHFGYLSSNSSSTLVLEALLCDHVENVFASIQCSSGDMADVLLWVDSMNPGRYIGSINFTSDVASVASHDLIISLDSSELVPCISTIHLPSGNKTLSRSLYRHAEPELSASFDSSTSIRACIWDADAISFGLNGNEIEFLLEHSSGKHCSIRLSAYETAPLSELFCRSNINLFDILNTSTCKYSTLSDYIMMYKGAQIHIPIRSPISFLGTSSSALIGSSVSVVASVSTSNLSTSLLDLIVVYVRFSSGIQERLMLRETDASSFLFRGSLFIPSACNKIDWNRSESRQCHDKAATYVELFYDFLQPPFLISLFLPPEFYFSPLYPVIGLDVVASVVVSNFLLPFVDAIVSSSLQEFPIRFACSRQSSLCSYLISGTLFQSSPLMISLRLSYGIFNSTVIGMVAPAMKSSVSFHGVHNIWVTDCDSAENSTILTATCDSTIHNISLFRNGCILKSSVNVSRYVHEDGCLSVVLNYRNVNVFTHAILALYDPTLGIMNVPATVAAGSSFSATVHDLDANLNPIEIDTIMVTACSSRQVEPCENIQLRESASSSGIFSGTIVTVLDASVSHLDDGVINLLPSHFLNINYFDNSSSRSVMHSVRIVAPCSWLVNSIPHKIYAGDVLSISVKDLDMNPVAQGIVPTILIFAAGLWSNCTLFEDTDTAGVYVGTCDTTRWPVDSMASIYYNCSRSSLQLSASIYVVSSPIVIVDPNPIEVGGFATILVFDSVVASTSVVVSLFLGSTNTMPLTIPRTNSSAFALRIPTKLANETQNCSFPMAFLPSTRYVNVSYSVANRRSSFAVVQVTPKTFLNAKLIFPNLWVEVINPGTVPYDLEFVSETSNISCSVLFSLSDLLSLRLTYSSSVQNMTCNTTTIIIPSKIQFDVRSLSVNYLNTAYGAALKQQVSIPYFPSFDAPNISCVSRFLPVTVSGFLNFGSNVSLLAQSFSSSGSIVGVTSTLLQNDYNGRDIGTFKLSSSSLDGHLLLIPQGYVEFQVNGFKSSRFYLYPSCSVSIFADFVNSSMFDIFIDVRMCSNDSVNVSVSTLHAQAAITLSMSQVPSFSLQVLQRGLLPVSFSTQTSGVLLLTPSSIVQVTALIAGGETISKSFYLPAWRNLSCFSMSDSSRIGNAVALGRLLVVSSTPNSDFSDPIQIQFSIGNYFERIPAAKQSNGDWMSSLLVELYSSERDGKLTNFSVGSTIIASIGHLSCSATVYMPPSLTLSSNFDGSSWILKIYYVASSQMSSPAVRVHAKNISGVTTDLSLQRIAPFIFLGTLNVGSSSCYNLSASVMDFYEGNLSSAHQLPCSPILSVRPSSNRSAFFVFQGELLDIEVDFTNNRRHDVTVMVQYDNHNPTVVPLIAPAVSQLFRVTVAANANQMISVYLSVDGFILSSSIQVVQKPIIRFYPSVVRPHTTELFVFVTDALQSSLHNTSTVTVSISGCSIGRNVLLNCTKENGVFVGSLALLQSEKCIGMRIMTSYSPHSASSNFSAVVFASPVTDISVLTITPASAIAGDFVNVTLIMSPSALQPAGFILSVHGDPCGTDDSSSVVLLPSFSGSNTFSTILDIGFTASVISSCSFSIPGRYVLTASSDSSGLLRAYLDIVSSVSDLTLNTTRLEQGRPVGITVIDPKAKRRSNVIVTFKALGYSIELFLQRTGELFSGSLEYELVAWFLAEGLSSVECTIEYVDAVGSVANANVLLGSPLIPENVHVGDVIAFTISSPRLCFVPPSRVQVFATTSSFPDSPLNVSVVSLFTGTSCQLSCRFKTSLYASTGYLESLETLTALPNDTLLINVRFSLNETIVLLKSQSSFTPTARIVAPSYISVGSALDITLTGFGSHGVSVFTRNMAFQSAVISNVTNSSSSTLSIRSSNFAHLPLELYVRPGDFISIQAISHHSRLFSEIQTAVAEVATIQVDPENPEFGSTIQVHVFDSDAPAASEATVSIVRNGKKLLTSSHRIYLLKRTSRILSAQFNLSLLIFSRMTDSLIISYEDSAPKTVVSYNVSFRQIPQSTIAIVNFSGSNLTSTLSLKSSGQLQLNIMSKAEHPNHALPLSCNVYSFQSGSSPYLDMEAMILFPNSHGELWGSIELLSVELLPFSRQCAGHLDGCLAVHPQHVLTVTCGNEFWMNVSLGQLPIHGFFSDTASNFTIFTGYPDTFVNVTAVDTSDSIADHSCQSICTRISGTSVISCSLCESVRTFQAQILPSPSLNLPYLTFKSEFFASLRSFALADSSLFCESESAAFANIALSESSSSCGDCYSRIAIWNSSSSTFELVVTFPELRPYLNSSSCLHVWIVLPAQVKFSSAVCFTAPEFTTLTPLQDTVFPLGLECSREVIVSVKSGSVCYRLQPENESIRVISISSGTARISWQYSRALQLPTRVCVQAFVAPFGCDGPMGSGPRTLFSTRCWSLDMEPCVACASIGDNLVTISRRYSVDPVAVASIFFAARADITVSDSSDVDTELPFGTPVRLGLVYEGSAGESLLVSERFSLSNRAAIETLNPNRDTDASIEGELVCLPVDVQQS